MAGTNDQSVDKPFNMPADANLVLETRNVCKYYRKGSAQEVRALHDISLTIAQGSFTALAGPSGSGKTTLLALLGALERPSAGQVVFLGRDLSDFSDVALARARRRMGFVFQDFSLIPALSVWDNITYPLIPRGVSRAARYASAKALLSRFGLEGKLLARPGELSGGEQQRVALSRALAGQPEVLLVDEPTSNLDPEAGRTVLAMLEELHGEGRTIILASHDPHVIGLATRVYELERGKLKSPF
jgi:putative ABC transport system ATP-binding protein